MTTQTFENDAILFLSDARGVYIPRDFAESVDEQYLKHASKEDMDILKSGPDHEWYWEAWTTILDNAEIHANGKVYYLWQDGDLFLVPDGCEIPEF